jgi:hypothetical protein
MSRSLLKELNKREKQIKAGTHQYVEVPIEKGKPVGVDLTGRDFQEAFVKISKPRKEYKHMTKAEREAKKKAQERQPTLEAAMGVVIDQPKHKEITMENNTLTERFHKAWNDDMGFVRAHSDAEKSLAAADVSQKSSALIIGRLLVEIRQAALHGDLKKFIIAELGETEKVMDRCNYCIRVARQTDGDEREKEKEAELAALAEKAEAAKKLIITAEAGTAANTAKQNANVVKKQQKVVKKFEQVTAKTIQKRAMEIAERRINEQRFTLYSEVDKIAQELKSMIKMAADSKQPWLDFTACDKQKIEIRDEIESLVSKVVDLANEVRAEASAPVTDLHSLDASIQARIDSVNKSEPVQVVA